MTLLTYLLITVYQPPTTVNQEPLNVSRETMVSYLFFGAIMVTLEPLGVIGSKGSI